MIMNIEIEKRIGNNIKNLRENAGYTVPAEGLALKCVAYKCDEV